MITITDILLILFIFSILLFFIPIARTQQSLLEDCQVKLDDHFQPLVNAHALHKFSLFFWLGPKETKSQDDLPTWIFRSDA